MEFKLINEKKNTLFNRKEIEGTMDFEVTPSREQVLEVLSKQFSVPSGNIKIKGIRSKYGSKVFNIEANIYSSEEDKESIELKKKKEQSKAVPEQEAAPAEQPKEEAVPAEEIKSEENPAEQ